MKLRKCSTIFISLYSVLQAGAAPAEESLVILADDLVFLPEHFSFGALPGRALDYSIIGTILRKWISSIKKFL